MATHASAIPEKKETSTTGAPLTWALSLAACAYCLWTGVALFSSTRTFMNMYSSIGVDLSFSTRFVVAFYRLLYPALFGGAATLVIVKQYYVREKWANINATLGTVLVANIVSNWIASSLYQPLWDLMEKLNK